MGNHKKPVTDRGRTLYIDPNPDGQEYINPEDLSILVELTTDSKARSTITGGGGVKTTGNNSGSISFLEGSPLGNGGKRSLTTSYTEIGTTFIKPSDDSLEGFGMTDIDIGFNTSYAPLVKIKFTDIRGGALTRGTSSKYNVFFELPYPIFRLKVKGYYGKAVMYCLHMTKWNGEFNSKTGNFEIEAEFIGYTYAMLTDILMGYLKAIPYTTIGGEKFQLLKTRFETISSDGTINSPIITIDEMLASISKFNEEIKKFKQTDPTYKKLLGINKANNILAQIKGLQSDFFKQAQIGDSKQLISDGETWLAVMTDGDEVKNLVSSYNEEVDKKVDELKKVIKSTSITKEKFHVIVTAFNDRIDTYQDFDDSDDYNLSGKGGSGDDTNHANNLVVRFESGIPDDNAKFTLYDLFNASKEFNRINNRNKELEVQTKSDLAVKLRNVAKLSGNFNPSIRNIFRILTVHCEALMMTIQQVASDAEEPSNTPRHDSLTNLGRNNLSVPSNSTIYAFPEFNNEFGEETYLGDRVLASDVNEVAFIEDLLNAFIKSKQSDLTAETLRLNTDIDWFALTPIDTKASQVGGQTTNPYREGLVKHEDDLLRKLMYRTFLYLGTANDSIDTELIQYMAKIEANNLYYGTREMVLRDTIATNYSTSNAIIEHFKKGSNNINNYTGGTSAIPYMTEISGNYQYKYISDNKRAYIPINGDFDGQSFYTAGKLKSDAELKSLGNTTLFTGNYINGNIDTIKVDDGAKYVKILDRKEYLNYAFSMPLDDIIKLKEDYDKKYEPGTRAEQGNIENGLKEDAPIKGLNPLDTKFGVTEFFEVKAGGGYPNSNLDNIKNDVGNSLMMPAFYMDSNISNNVEDRTGTMLRRASGLVDVRSGDTNNLSKLNVGENKSLINDALVTGTTGIVVDRVEFGFADKKGSGSEITTQSLFGSALYYAQAASEEEDLSKAFLFVNTFPMVGMKTPIFTNTSTQGRTILGTLASNSGFVSVPSSWIYWIGSLLWRDKYFIDNAKDPIITKIQYNGNIISPVPTVKTWPTTKELWYATGVLTSPALQGPTMLLCGDEGDTATYRAIEDTIMHMPEQVKEEFLNKFLLFVENEWLVIKEGLETYITPVGQEITAVGTNSDAAFMNDWVNTGRNNITDPDICVINGDSPMGTNALVNPSLGNLNYHRATPKIFSFGKDLDCDEYNKGVEPVWYNLDMVEDTPVNRRVVDLMLKRSVIMNYNPYTFRPNTSTATTEAITIDVTKANDYLALIGQEYKDLHEKHKAIVKDEQSIKNKVFQSSSNKAIKLNLYRHISALNNKWLGSNNDQNNLFLSCQISDASTNLAAADGRPAVGLIDTFFFLNAAYTDIGDDFLLNPKIISDMISSNYNQSFFDYINRILADNNFNFIPLPTFVNFKTIDGMREIFEPYSYKDIASNGANLSAGPSFVCVYAGQLSKHLDLGSDADYPDDGLDLSGRQGVTLKNIDYNLSADSKTGGLSLPVFAVNYAQQNQNYFKDIKLDQKEFTETDEGLHIIDDISKSGDKNKSTYVGQNLFNVYQTRSYSAEVEALGMPLIQPMMYFQLNNIPMFRGAYLIINTSHKIKPNHMTTKFKGVRVRDVKPPKVDSIFEITELLGEIDGAESLEYSLDETNYDNKPKPVSGDTEIVYPDDTLDESTRNYYKLGYVQGRSFSNAYFNKPSNTKRNDIALTYTDVLEEVSKITKVPLIVLKTMSVIESTVGQDRTVKRGAPNNSGFLGLMQFGRPASIDVKNKIEAKVFDLGLTFGATTDSTNKKLILPPAVKGNQWSSFKSSNNNNKNSMYDDFISALGGAYYAIQNLRVGDPSTITTKNIIDIYLSHQQGRGGYSTIKSNPTELLCNPENGKLVGTANNMKNNPPIKELNTRGGGLKCGTTESDKIVFKQWVAAWQGIIDMIIHQLQPSYVVSNADRLRRVLKELGYKEKGSELDNNGDITQSMANASSSVFSTIKFKYPNLMITVTGGNDLFHKTIDSRHRKGRAIDFVISPSSTNDVANIKTILQGYAAGNNNKFRFLDEYSNPTVNASGKHFHISWWDSGGTEGSGNLADAIALSQATPPIETYLV